MQPPRNPSRAFLIIWGIVLMSAILFTCSNYVRWPDMKQPRRGGGTPVTQTPSPHPTIPATLAAWIYPDVTGSAACSASQEYKDGRQVDVLKPQYFDLNDVGTLVQNSASTLCNGYSAANAADVKAHSREQYVTISGGSSGIIALATHTTIMNNFLSTITTFLDTTGFTGVELDCEGFGSWNAATYAQYKQVVNQLGQVLHAKGHKLMVDGPIIMNATYQQYYFWRWEDFDKMPVDYLVSMCYDMETDRGVGNPVSTLADITGCCQWMKDRISDPNRIVIGLPSYAYRGTVGQYTAKQMASLQVAKIPGLTDATRDASSGELIWNNGAVAYSYSDSTTMDMKLQAVLSQGIKNISVWALGQNPWFGMESGGSGSGGGTQNTPTAFDLEYPGFRAWYARFFDDQGNYLG